MALNRRKFPLQSTLRNPAIMILIEVLAGFLELAMSRRVAEYRHQYGRPYMNASSLMILVKHMQQPTHFEQ